MSDLVKRLRDLAQAKHDDLSIGDEAADRIAKLEAILQWFVNNDETIEGDTPMPEHGGRTWNEINAYWIEGLNRARDLLKSRAALEGGKDGPT